MGLGGRIVLGLTGSFGSGCSTLRDGLKDAGFMAVTLSKYVHDIWEKRNPDKPPESAPRQELQSIGNALRKEQGNSCLACKALEEAHSGEKDRLVFDSIRNTEEIEEFRKYFHNFILIAVNCSLEERWKRLKEKYEQQGLAEKDFLEDYERDANEDITYGQQVRLCVDNADITIKNERHFDPEHARKDELRKKAEQFIPYVAGQDIRPPNIGESMMAAAYTQALGSMCYKRQVGAIIHDENGVVLGVGCNNNPPPLYPCHEQWGECRRDTYKRDLFEDLKKDAICCPKCAKPLKDCLSADYKCTTCGCDVDKYYVRDRALSRCSASHAEEAAIIDVGGKNLKGCTIYTTTFPCLLCMQKIIRSGIKKIVYCEPYPDHDSGVVLGDVNEKLGSQQIEAELFEGIKARAYFRVFGRWRREQETRINIKRGVK